MENPVDTWIQRATTAAMVALAAVLIAVGVTLYVPLPHPHSRSAPGYPVGAVATTRASPVR